ncbi:MAG: hypothetical protein R3338_03630 [Thermoanaerobaculia bacterium]|nr:hypothetical protein [Thermoanaerobaculia bacterium]
MSDRKYGHKGYQDSDVDRQSGDRGNLPPRKERLEGAPRGRTAGGFGPEAFKCARCGTLQQSLGEVEFDATCRQCDADLHTCTNCKNFDTSARWECREERIPERVSPKDARNECTFFAPKIVRDLNADKARAQTPDDARAAFEALFKK